MAAGSMFSSLRHRVFRRVWAATVVDQTGNWLQIAGRAWLIYHVTGSTTSLGAIYFLSYLPQLLLSQVAGVFADRYDRRRLLMVGEVLMGLGAVGMAVIAATGTASLVNIGVISVVVGVVILTTFVVAGVGQVYQPLSVAFTTKVLAHGDDGTGASYYGIFQAAIGVGSAAGILAMTVMARRQPRRTFVGASIGCAAFL